VTEKTQGTTTPIPEVQGSLDPSFRNVEAAFRRNWQIHDEVGAALSVSLGRERVVDLWGGWVDASRTRPWLQDTVVLTASVGKSLLGVCANLLIQQGILDPRTPVAHYWPEFAANGKSTITLGALLNHTAGLPIDPPNVDLTDWDAVVNALVNTAPMWKPGEGHYYHTHTMGFLVGEVVRRVTGLTPNEFLQAEVAGPLGADAWFGLPESEDWRRADIVAVPGFPAGQGLADVYNSRAWRRAEIPAANAHTNARGLVTIFQHLQSDSPSPLLTPETVSTATSNYVTGTWYGEPLEGRGPYLPAAAFQSRFARGFVRSNDWDWFGPNEQAFGGHGVTGAVVFVDREKDLTVAYTPNAFTAFHASQESRSGALIEAVYASM
jgi:CubicO group peptidase (beta-lactamase class C family)